MVAGPLNLLRKSDAQTWGQSLQPRGECTSAHSLFVLRSHRDWRDSLAIRDGSGYRRCIFIVFHGTAWVTNDKLETLPSSCSLVKGEDEGAKLKTIPPSADLHGAEKDWREEIFSCPRPPHARRPTSPLHPDRLTSSARTIFH